MLHGNNPDHTLTLKTIFLAIITYYYVTYYSQCAGNCVGGCGGGSCYPGDALFDYSLLRRWPGELVGIWNISRPAHPVRPC
jgi:hypothetical protein